MSGVVPIANGGTGESTASTALTNLFITAGTISGLIPGAAEGAGLGIRSKRYAAVIEDGIVTALLVEPERGLNVSSAESVLAAL